MYSVMHLTHPFTTNLLKLESVFFYPPYKGDCNYGDILTNLYIV